jgi:hypothetical protein
MESRTMTSVTADDEVVEVEDVDEEDGEAHAIAEKTTIVKIENRCDLDMWAPNGETWHLQRST